MEASARTVVGTVVCIILAVSLLILTGPSLGLSSGAEVPFEVIEQGGCSRYEERSNFTITNQTAWENLWLEMYSGFDPIPDAPTINFTSEMLIAVFQGFRPTGGYWTNITRIVMTGTYYVVYVNEVHPSKDCVVIMVNTYPHQIVKISNHSLDLPVYFIYNIIIHKCG